MRIRKFQEPVGKSHYRVRAWTNVQTGGKRVRVVIPASPVSSPLSPSLMLTLGPATEIRLFCQNLR